MLDETFVLECIGCRRKYPPEIYYYKCPMCGGVLYVRWNYELLKDKTNKLINKNDFSMWRYRSLLPIRDSSKIISLKEGWTPLIKAERLSKQFNIKNIFLKDEIRNPSGSFLDRGVSVEVTKAIESGFTSLACGSTGNLAVSVAAYAARSGMKSYIFVPRRIDIGKLYQIAVYGAEIYLVNSYEEAIRRSEMMFLESHIITIYNPWYLEGIKTTGLEIAEQSNYALPDHIIVAAGSGAHVVMIYKAFEELMELGLLEDIHTKLIAVQSEVADPITKAFKAGVNHITPVVVTRETVASDIAIGHPIHGNEVLKVVRETGGSVISVSDGEILEALSLLAKSEGILAEPSAAASLAGALRLVNEGSILPSESIVIIITGAGLKHPKAIRDTVSKVETLKKILSMVEGYKEVSRLGETKIRILQAISEGYTYGYMIWKTLKNKFGIAIGLPTLYQHLKELERMGLITVFSEERTGGRKSIHYALTERGKKIAIEFT